MKNKKTSQIGSTTSNFSSYNSQSFKIGNVSNIIQLSYIKQLGFRKEQFQKAYLGIRSFSASFTSKQDLKTKKFFIKELTKIIEQLQENKDFEKVIDKMANNFNQNTELKNGLINLVKTGIYWWIKQPKNEKYANFLREMLISNQTPFESRTL